MIEEKRINNQEEKEEGEKKKEVKEVRFKRIVLFLVLSLLLCETSFLYEQYQNLREIGSKFEVVIEDFAREKDIKKIGLTKERLRTVAELRLRKEGMTIVDEKNREIPADEKSEIPMVYINVNVVGLAYNINLMICEDVVLKRPSSVTWILAPIWGRSITGTHGGRSEEIISSLNMLLDGFFNDYYKANPKEKKEVRE